jgi:hypothetical protein
MISSVVWREVALWWAEPRALIVAEAVGTAPAFALGRCAGVHPMLRLTPPGKQLSPFQPECLFVGYGEAIESGADAALRVALVQSRRDLPRLVMSVPNCCAAPELRSLHRRREAWTPPPRCRSPS